MKLFRTNCFSVIYVLLIPVLFSTLSLQTNAPTGPNPASTIPGLTTPVLDGTVSNAQASDVTASNVTSSDIRTSETAFIETGDNLILVELCSQGLLDPAFLRTNEKFGALVDTQYPLVLEGFRVWAPPVVNWMRRSKQIALWVSKIATPWMAEMAYVMGEQEKGSLIGKAEMYLGFITSWIIGVTLTYGYVQMALLLLVSFWMYLSLRRLLKALPIPVWSLIRKNVEGASE